MKAVLYADNDGVPGALLGVSNEVTVTADQSWGWVDFPFASSVAVSAGPIWMGYIADSTTHLTEMKYDTVSGALAYNSNSYAGGASDPFGSADTAAFRYSLYATLSGSSSSTTDYTYDDLGRLSTVSGAPFATPGTYCYDADSNRTKTYSSATASCSDASPTATYTYTTGTSTPVDALTSQTGPTRSFTYDSDGNMTGRGSDSFGWDTSGRLHTATISSTGVTYTYSPDGSLKTRTTTSPSKTTNYLLNDLFETDGSGVITESSDDGPGGDLASHAGAPANFSSFGNPTIGSATDNATNAYKEVSRYTAVAGSVSRLTGYISGLGAGSGTQHIEAVIYADSSGSPGALLGTSSEVTVTAGQDWGWVDFPFASPVTVSAGAVWMGYIATTTSNLTEMRYTRVSGALAYNANSYGSGPSDPFGSADAADFQYSLYATINVGTFGSTSIGVNTDNATADYKFVSRYPATAGSVTSLTGYISGLGAGSGSQDLKAVIYSDSSGAPGTLLGTSQAVTVVAGQDWAWIQFPFGSPVTVSTSPIWLGFIATSTNNLTELRYHDVTGDLAYNTNTYTSGPTDPFGTASVADEQLSLYATITPDAPTTYLSYDGHGDTVAETDADGSPTGAETYDPFGAAENTQLGNTATKRYLARWGEQSDTTANLVLMGARPYDPALGRFLAVDPIDGGSLNNYDYAGQDPINGYDLDGQSQCDSHDARRWGTGPSAETTYSSSRCGTPESCRTAAGINAVGPAWAAENCPASLYCRHYSCIHGRPKLTALENCLGQWLSFPALKENGRDRALEKIAEHYSFKALVTFMRVVGHVTDVYYGVRCVNMLSP